MDKLVSLFVSVSIFSCSEW